MKAKFYKLRQASNPSASKISSSFNYGHKNKEKLLRKYPSCDYHYYYDPQSIIVGSHRHQRQRQASFKKDKAPHFFYFSQDPNLNYDTYENSKVKNGDASSSTLMLDQSTLCYRNHHPYYHTQTRKVPLELNKKTLKEINYESYLKNVTQRPSTTTQTTILPINQRISRQTTELINPSSSLTIVSNLKPSNLKAKPQAANYQNTDRLVELKATNATNPKKEVKFVSKMPTSTIEYSIPNSLMSDDDDSQVFIFKNNQNNRDDWSTKTTSSAIENTNDMSQHRKQIKNEDYQPITKYIIQNEASINDVNYSLASSKLDEESNAQFMMKKLKRTTSV